VSVDVHLGDEQGLDRSRRYLRPVRATVISDDPDGVHLALYTWLPTFEAWATGPGICGESMQQGPLPEGTEVTCAACLKWQPKYELILAHDSEASDEAGDTPENGAWHTVWLEGNWWWTTKKMTTPQREYAADRVAAYSRYLATCDGDLEREEPEGLRWWREASR
jgi:hypothetical protein